MHAVEKSIGNIIQMQNAITAIPANTPPCIKNKYKAEKITAVIYIKSHFL